MTDPVEPLYRRSGSACGLCGRPLNDYRTCDKDDSAMDCGGDCLACMRELEEWPPTPQPLVARVRGVVLLWKITAGQWSLANRLEAAWACLRRGYWSQHGRG